MAEQHFSKDELITSRVKRKSLFCRCESDSQGIKECVSHGLITSCSNSKSFCRCDDDYKSSKEEIFSELSLPEDILSCIHSLMDLQDAARAACLSRSFLQSWRYHPYLIFNDETLGCKENTSENNEIARDFYSIVDGILNNHSGIGVKTLKIQVSTSTLDAVKHSYINRWLQIAVTPGIEELMLSLPVMAKYNFPYSLLSRRGDSIQYLHLGSSLFRPTSEFGWLKNLKRLHLCAVSIKEDELGRLLSYSLALERLEIRYCDGIVCLKIPCVLKRLSYLEVICCKRLRVIDSDAPNISTFYFISMPRVKLSLGKTLQMKNLEMFSPDSAHYVRVKLPSSMPNLETVTISSTREMANIPMLNNF